MANGKGEFIIPLSGSRGQGLFAIVDEEDYDYLSQFKWNLTSHGYVRRGYGPRTNNHKAYMHQEVMGVGPNTEIDHWNRNKLDNRRSNLRLSSHSENVINTSLRTDNTSGYKGVTLHNPGWWKAQINVNGRHYHLGTFRSPDDAARAYDEAALYYFGEYAYLNFGHGESG